MASDKSQISVEVGYDDNDDDVDDEIILMPATGATPCVVAV